MVTVILLHNEYGGSAVYLDLSIDMLISHGTTSINYWSIYSNILQISLLEECGFLERAIEELYRKESKIVSIFLW